MTINIERIQPTNTSYVFIQEESFGFNAGHFTNQRDISQRRHVERRFLRLAFDVQRVYMRNHVKGSLLDDN